MSHEYLDSLIRSALHVEPSPEQIARLEDFWTEQCSTEIHRRHRWRAAALAATVLVALGAAVWLIDDRPKSQVQHFEQDSRIAQKDADQTRRAAPESISAVDALQDKAPLSVGRSPTAIERLAFTVSRRGRPTAESGLSAVTMNELIESLVREPNADAEELVASSQVATDDMERLLLRRLVRSTDAEKDAVFRLLAVCGSPRAVPSLLRFGRSKTFRGPALSTIEQIVGIERLAACVDQTRHPGVRAALIRRLLTANSAAGLRGYLSLVGDQSSRAEALATLDALPEPPAAALLDLLDNTDRNVRLSAAVVLGHLSGPEVTRALVDRITRDPANANEAWIALMACRGELAEEFLAYATRQPQLLPHFNSARVLWARVVN
jgi:HEAT repeat protein